MPPADWRDVAVRLLGLAPYMWRVDDPKFVPDRGGITADRGQTPLQADRATDPSAARRTRPRGAQVGHDCQSRVRRRQNPPVLRCCSDEILDTEKRSTLPPIAGPTVDQRPIGWTQLMNSRIQANRTASATRTIATRIPIDLFRRRFSAVRRRISFDRWSSGLDIGFLVTISAARGQVRYGGLHTDTQNRNKRLTSVSRRQHFDAVASPVRQRLKGTARQ